MTLRELNLRIFRREPVDRVLWQPRIEHWYNVNKQEGTLPGRYRNLSLLEVFDDLGCSVRPYWSFNACVRIKDDERVTRETRTEADRDRIEALTLFGAGRIRQRRGDLAGALRYYQRAFRYDPQSAAVARAIVPLAFQLNRHDEAIRTLQTGFAMVILSAAI